MKIKKIEWKNIFSYGNVIQTIEFDDEGKVKDGEKLKDGLKTEWADFIPTTKTEGAKTATPLCKVPVTLSTFNAVPAVTGIFLVTPSILIR